MDVVSAHANKQVRFRFAGVDLHFRLSQGLFSSYDIDAGTKLLLKSIAQQIPLDSLRSALDVGSGVGTLGVSLGKRIPGCRVIMQDRDALAVAFTSANAGANGLKDWQARGSLALWGLGQQRFDLIASNVPAKAGPPVLRWFFRHASSYLAEEGTVAIVVVDPLADISQEALAAEGCHVLHTESTKNHRVFHFRGPRVPVEERLDPYLRGRARFELGSRDYEIDTVYNLPEFDNRSYGTVLIGQMLSSLRLSGRIGFWNPGQGHLCMMVSLTGGPESYVLAGRDVLELRISEQNTADAAKPLPTCTYHVASPPVLAGELAEGSLQTLVYVARPVPGVRWYQEAVNLADHALDANGTLVIAGKSSDLAQLVRQCRPFRLQESRKLRGFRCVVLRR